MQWTHLTRHGRPFRPGLAAWTTRVSQFHELVMARASFDDPSIPSCPPGRVRAQVETSDLCGRTGPAMPAGNAGSPAARRTAFTRDEG